jgi:hypothetical protein
MLDDVRWQRMSAARREPVRRMLSCRRDDVYATVTGRSRKSSQADHWEPLKVSAVASSYRCVPRAVPVRLSTVLVHNVAGARSPEPLAEDAQQCPRGVLIQPEHAAVRHVRVQHDGPVLFGHQQVRESSRAVRLARGHDHPAMATAYAALHPRARRGNLCCVVGCQAHECHELIKTARAVTRKVLQLVRRDRPQLVPCHPSLLSMLVPPAARALPWTRRPLRRTGDVRVGVSLAREIEMNWPAKPRVT